MIQIDPRATAVTRMTCPFCSYGCEFSIVSDDLGIRGVEYPADALPNTGRLCPRGSAAAFYMNHPRRLTLPVKDNLSVGWDKIVRDLKRYLRKPEQVAVTFDRNLTQEEYFGIMNFCSQNEVGVTASSYLEPEGLLGPLVRNGKPFVWADLDAANTVVIIGDLFQMAPMASKHIIEWRYRDRKNRLVVIDSLGTYTGKFATDFLKAGIGYEPLTVLALGGALDPSVDAGVPAARLRELGDHLKTTPAGLIFVTLPFGRQYDPILFIHALKTLGETTGKKVVPFVEFAEYTGTKRFGDVLEMVRTKKIKQIINFGEIFPYAYPQVVRQMKGAEIYASAVLKPPGTNSGLSVNSLTKMTMLPAALNLEKTGTVFTSLGLRAVKTEIPAASGAQNVNQILARFGTVDSPDQFTRPVDFSVAVAERIGILKRKIQNPKKDRYLLVGEKTAFNFMAFWEAEHVRINPADARRIAVKPGESVMVRSKNGEAEFAAELSDAIPAGVLAVPAETGRTKFLFEFEIDQGFVNFPPTDVELCRKE